MELYKRIRNRREELGMTQDELAIMMGYKSRSSINKIELGKSDIPQSKIAAFAKALETTPEYLMGFDSEPDYAELDIFEEVLSLIGWSYKTLYNCNGLYVNQYLDDKDKIECEGNTSYEKCYHCVHGQPYYYLSDSNRYYKLSKEEFDNLSSCLIPYLRFRINELVSKKQSLSEYEYKKEEYLIDTNTLTDDINSESKLIAANSDGFENAPEESRIADLEIAIKKKSQKKDTNCV